jgi:hypothetical protein
VETLIFLIVLALLAREGVKAGSAHWQHSKAANRAGTRGQSVGKRAASAARHDFGYWLHQVLNGFPQTRHGIAESWHAGRQAQAEGYAARQKAKAEHLSARARLIPELREHQRRQAEALEQIRAARQPEPEFPVLLTGRSKSGKPVNPVTGEPHDTITVWGQDDLRRRLAAAAADPDMEVTTRPVPGPAGSSEGTPEGTSPGTSSSTSTTEGSAMPTGTTSGDTTYTQQLSELEAMQRDAEADLASTARKRLVSRLDILQGMGLDSATLADAAAIDDALQAAEKAAQQVLEMTTTAIANLKRRHGGIQEAVSDSPVDKPAEPGFYEQ